MESSSVENDIVKIHGCVGDVDDICEPICPFCAFCQSLADEVPESPVTVQSSQQVNLSIGFTDLNASLHELEDNDLDALMADLVADLSATEEKFAAERGGVQELPAPTAPAPSAPPRAEFDPAGPFAPPPPQPKEDAEAQMKADKIKLALEKLKEAKVKKLIVKVEMTDGSSKTLMVDERQTVRDVIDSLFEKTHCTGSVDWCLCETNPELQTERGFEDHENLVEPLSAWTRDSENKVLFQERKNKYEVFRNPQKFYMWKKEKKSLKDMKEKDKELLLEENFCGQSVIVPDLEGVLHLREEGKKSWRPRYFLLRASGMYYLPKGKTKSSRDLVCFVQFDNTNVYYCKECKTRFKAPTEYCFILKHPQIQKESQYIKYLCCDDQWAMELWVTGIRIAKYGKALYENYRSAVRRSSLSSIWTNLNQQPSPSTSNAPTPSPTPKGAQNFSQSNQASFPPPPSTNVLPPPPPDPMMPPPPPMPVRAEPPPLSSALEYPQPAFLPPPPELPLPPPPIDDMEPPPDFLPPPPPSFACELPPPPPPPPQTNHPSPPPVFNPPFEGGELPPPPPPPPPPATATAPHPTPKVKKVGPPPPTRTTPSATAPSGGDFMSELMVAMQKKRSGQ
uniref:Amyloid beta A4 precursor protein-binding family B member 1-interacting protein n=1 Tax=Electrophorus electricus TaxID=8005 RepID=A0A4W4E7W1_ELEEL